MAMPRAREGFDRDLGRLEAQVVLLGGLVEAAILTSLLALKTRDSELAEEVISDDDLIDRKRDDIEEECFQLLGRESPVAGDLRRLLTILQVAGELERIGDYAEGIAKIAMLTIEHPAPRELVQIARMGERSVSMLKHSLDAFLERDAVVAEDRAVNIGPDDEAVDRLYEQLQSELIDMMRENPDNVRPGTYLLWVGHNLERIADRATNIAERVVFQATGRVVPIGNPAEPAD